MPFLANLILVFLAVMKEDVLSETTDISWPSGYYGLPKAKSGCPAEHAGVRWCEGWIEQDLEFGDNRNRKSNFSSSFHIDAALTDKKIKRAFCMKVTYGKWKLWPKGTYCIYKKYSCPKDMIQGSIKWDDENDNNDNRQSSSSGLPSGTYNDNTLIKYCCQDQGYWFNSIELPTNCAFYLLPYKSSRCQRVKWALSSLEYIVYDTEDDYNDDRFTNNHVFTNEVKSSPKVFYCYYQECRHKLSGDNGSFASSENVSYIYPDFQYCSWVVTVNETFLVSLSFAFIRVPNCQENYIDIYDGSNDTFPLLSRYCGLNATVGNIVKSTGNSLYVVFKSGNNSLNAEIFPEFRFNYKTRLIAKPLVPVWPYGTYGLPKAITGCPESRGLKWAEGFITQDMNDKDRVYKSKLSDSFHMEAQLIADYKDVNRTFCVKTHLGIYKTLWPKGTYCIYKKNQCPSGMTEGSIQWDNENTANYNEHGGILPDGTYLKYDHITIMEYCCQNQGYWFNSIELPVDHPFYLLPYKSSHCQRVKWALSSLEYIVYDTEDYHNDDKFTDSHVFTNEVKSLPKVYYCYYQGCSHKLKGDTGSFSSSGIVVGIYPDFQYCSWLVTVNETLLVSLSFTVIHIPNCQDNYIDVYDGSNETFPLVARYCGFNATDRNKVKLTSTGNSVYVVLKSGNNSLNPGIYPLFNAHYKTQLIPTSCSHKLKGDTGSFSSSGIVVGIYPDFQYCSWLVTVNETLLVSLSFTVIHIPNCQDNYIDVYDGSNETFPLVARYCGFNATDRNNEKLTSTGNSVYVVLKLGNNSLNPGIYPLFNAHYKTQLIPTSCSHKLKGDTGSFSSSGIVVGIYPDFQYCSWLVTVNETLLVSLSFTVIHIPNCQDNYIDVYDGSNETFPLVARYCGFNATDRNNEKLTSTGNSVYVVLKLGNNSLNPGIYPLFNAHYKTQLIPTKTFPTATFEPTDMERSHSTNPNSNKHDRQSGSQSDSIRLIAIILPICAGLFVLLVLIIIYRKRHKNIAGPEVGTRHNNIAGTEVGSSSNPIYDGTRCEMSTVVSRSKKMEDVAVVGVAGKQRDNPIYEQLADGDPRNEQLYCSMDNMGYNGTANIKDDPVSFYNQPGDGSVSLAKAIKSPGESNYYVPVGINKSVTKPEEENVYEFIK